MKHIISCISITLCILFVNNSIAQDLIAPNWQFVNQTENNNSRFTLTTSDGNIYRAFYDGITKYDANGKQIWKKNTILGTNIAFKKNSQDELYIYNLSNKKKIIFGTHIIDNPDEKYLGSIIKLDSAANIIWVKSIINASASTKSSLLAADNEGNVYVSGAFNNIVKVDSVELPAIINKSNFTIYQVFVAKFSATGNLMWFKSVGRSNYEYLKSTLLVDQLEVSPTSQKLAITGFFKGDTLIFGGDTTIKNATKLKSFTAYIDSSGIGSWSNIELSKDFSSFQSIKLLFDNDNNLISYYNTDKTTSISKINSTNELLHTKSFANSIGNSSIGDLTIDEQDNIYVGISFSGSPLILQNNPKVEIPNTEEFSESDAVLVKLDSAFNLKWYKHILSTGNETFKALTINNNSLYSFGVSKTKEVGDSVYFGSFTHRATTRNEEFNFLTKINLCNQTSFPKLELNNGILEAPSTWKNWRWFVDDEEIEGINWFSHSPKKSGTYVVGTREKNGCVTYTEPFVWYATGIDDINATDIVINVYPNPANKTFTLKTSELVDNISIYTIGGQLIKNIPTNSEGEYKINIQNSGLYFIKVSSPNGYLTEKVVIW